jgi:hypothetical protein
MRASAVPGLAWPGLAWRAHSHPHISTGRKAFVVA